MQPFTRGKQTNKQKKPTGETWSVSATTVNPLQWYGQVWAGLLAFPLANIIPCEIWP